MKLARLSDSEAHDLLCEIRWGRCEEQVCPRCGIKHKAYAYPARKQFRCRHCKHQFSVTSGTIFANRNADSNLPFCHWAVRECHQGHLGLSAFP